MSVSVQQIWKFKNNYYISIMKKLLFIIPLLFACEKEEPQPTPNPTCACQKQYQVKNGNTWVNQNMSSVETQDCSVNGDVVYIDSTYRYYWVCQ